MAEKIFIGVAVWLIPISLFAGFLVRHRNLPLQLEIAPRQAFAIAVLALLAATGFTPAG